MTDPTFDPRLAERMRAYTQGAVVEFDPLTIADAAVAARGRPQSRPNLLSRLAAGPTLAWLAVALVVGLIIASVAGVFVGNRPHLAQTPPSPPTLVTSTASPSGTASPPSEPVAEGGGGSCITERVNLVSGAAMGPAVDAPDGMPRLGPGQGVIITTSDPAAPEIWLVRGGRASAQRIGEVRGAADWLNVLGISTPASQALLRIGHYSGPDWSLSCADLYLVALDGSGARRLTTFGKGSSAIGGAISPDGTRVAYAARAQCCSVDVAVLDLTTGATVHEPSGCTSGTGSRAIAVSWSTEVDRFAVACDRAVIYDPTGVTPPVTVAEDTQIGIGWGGRTLMAGVSSSGAHQNGFHVDAVDPVSGHIVRGAEMANKTIDWVIGSGTFAPSGQRLVAESGDSAAAMYVIDANGGAPRAILSPPQYEGVDWSADERSVISPDFSDTTLYQIDVASGTRTTLGPLPPGYSWGAWRLP